MMATRQQGPDGFPVNRSEDIPYPPLKKKHEKRNNNQIIHMK